MSGQENGLTLGGLAEKLGALTERLGELERENTGLRRKVAALTGSGKGEAMVESAWASKDPVSRRALLGKAGAAAVVAAAAGTLLTPREAKADHYSDDAIIVNTVFTHRVYVTARAIGALAIEAYNTADREAAIHARNSAAGPAVRGLNTGTGVGVVGTGAIGVHGQTKTNGNGAVYGEHTGTLGFGVVGDGKGTGGAGVFGRNGGGHGVRGDGSIGVVGSSSAANAFGVYGRHFGANGYGVRGDGKGTGAGVLGRNDSFNSVGVQGEGTAIGVKGVGSTGYGGHFSGATAQVKLLPHANTGVPTTGNHQQGELFLDSVAALFVCTASGTPGTWRRVTTTAA